MRQVLKRLTRMTVGYGAVQWAGPALSLIFTPILTRILTPGDYGIADYVLTISAFASTIALFALPQALSTHYNDKPDDPDWQPQVIGSALALAILIGLPIGSLVVILAPKIAQTAFQNEQQAFLFRLVGGTLVFTLIQTILITAAQAALRVRWGMLFSLTSILATVAGNIIFIIVLRWGVTGMLLVPIFTSITLSVVTFGVMRRIISWPSPRVMRILLGSGAILLPTLIAGFGLQVGDRLFLVHYVSAADMGLYAIANKFAGLLHVLLTPVYSAWTPLALAIQHEPLAKQRYADMARYLIAIALLAALTMGLFARELLMIFTPSNYLPAAPYISFLTNMYVFTTMGVILGTGALAGKQLKAFSWTVLVGVVINLLLNFVLIPVYGVWGATIATLIGYLVPQVILYLVLQRRFPVPYPIFRIMGALLVHIFLLLAGILLPPMAFPIQIGVKLVLLGFLPITLIIFGVITRFELQQGWVFGKNLLSKLLGYKGRSG